MAELGLGDVLRRTGATALRGLPTYLATVGLLLAPAMATELAMVKLPDGSPVAVAGILGLLSVAAILLAAFSSLVVSRDLVEGRGTGLRRTMGRARDGLLTFLGVSFILGLLTSILAGFAAAIAIFLVAVTGLAENRAAVVAAVLPAALLGSYPYIKGFVAPLVAATEDHGVVDSLKRSGGLTKGNLLVLLVVVAVVALPYAAVLLAAPPSAPVNERGGTLSPLPGGVSESVHVLVQYLLFFVTYVLGGAATAVVYDDLTAPATEPGPEPVDAVLTADEPAAEPAGEASGSGTSFEVLDRDGGP